MDLFTRDHLVELAESQHDACVSIYIPTHRKADQVEQDPIRFRNMLREAREALQQRRQTARTIQRLLEPADALLKDGSFWEHQSDGLALFLAEGFHRHYRLPREFREQTYVGDHFYLGPLLPLLQANGRFYLLAVSQNSCRLFVGDRDRIQELDDQRLPYDLRSTLGWWRERQVNLHSMQRRPQSRGGDDTVIYHGHYEDTTKEDLAAYFQRIDRGVTGVLQRERAPLVFAGVDYLFPIYRSVNHYAELCEEPVEGNPDDASPEDLHRQAWSVVQPRFEQQVSDVLDDYGRRAAQGRTGDTLASILPAARDGLVETLIIAGGIQEWGRFDPQTGHVALDAARAPGSEDLIDRAVLLTLHTNGRVLSVDAARLPGGAKAVALLRAPASAVASESASDGGYDP